MKFPKVHLGKTPLLYTVLYYTVLYCTSSTVQPDQEVSSGRQGGGAAPTRHSCQYVCQHCLVHLGDIARYLSLNMVLHVSCTCSLSLHKTLSRYRAHNDQAETFYRHAISLAPSSGQPYNQVQRHGPAGEILTFIMASPRSRSWRPVGRTSWPLSTST